MIKSAGWKNYNLAIIVSLLALGLKYLFAPIIGPETPFLLLFAAVLISAWYGGLKPGLLASIICGIAGGIFSQYYESLDWKMITRAGVFIIEGTLLSLLIEQRKIADQNLANIKEQARVVIEAVGEFAILMLSPNGKIISWNPAAEKIFGYKSAEIIGQSVEMIVAQHKDHHLDITQELQRVLTMGCASDEHWLLHKDGSRFWASGTTSVIYQNGQVAGFVKVLRDNTKLKVAEAERDQLLQHEVILRQEAETASRIKDEFLTTISHELRTPLTAILGWTRLLRDGRLNQQLQSHAIETIERNAKLQTQIIDDLLDVSRIITGNLRLEIERIDLKPVIDTAIESLLPAANAKDITIIKELTPETYQINGDANRLQQVIWNLLSNAIKFTPAGGRVEISLQRVVDQLALKISDTGKGIRKEFMPYIFARFHQADSGISRNYGGLGLGLAIVRHIVELHGGMVQVESDGENQGATFTILIPRARAETNTTTVTLKQAIAEKPVTTDVTLEKVRIIIVDDDPAFCELLLAILGQAQAEVNIAHSALSAWQMLQEWPADILICDIVLPTDDGYWLIKKVRAANNSVLRNIPAIALTAYARKEDRFESLNSGFNLHISKPIEPAELIEVIADLTKPAKPQYRTAAGGR